MKFGLFFDIYRHYHERMRDDSGVRRRLAFRRPILLFEAIAPLRQGCIVSKGVRGLIAANALSGMSERLVWIGRGSRP